MTEKKMTKKDWFVAIREVVVNSAMENREDAVAFIDHEIELLETSAARKTPTKTQKENLVVMEEIKNALLEVAKPVTITELMASSEALRAYSSQKISALIKLMKDKGEIIRTEEKKKAYFSLA